MSTINPSIVEGMRRNRAAILRAMSAMTQARVAESMGISEATLSRMKDSVGDKPSDIDRLSSLLAACGLIAQPVTNQSITSEHLTALRVLAREALDTAPASGFGALDEMDRG